MSEIRSILVVRRDNIGDLVCTTPLLSALRRRFPVAWLGAWVNSYNAPVLEGNPDLDEVCAYTKLKHLDERQSALRTLGARLAQLWSLRQRRLDCVVLATTEFRPRELRLARSLAPHSIAGFRDGGAAASRLDLWVPAAAVAGRHEVERVYALASLFGIEGAIPPLRVTPEPAQVEKARAAFGVPSAPRVAVHVSARRPAQRWPAERFAALIERLHAAHGTATMLLWAPGAADHPRHPGDDEKAQDIVRRVGGRAPLMAYPTRRLTELIGALAACDLVVCPDGGAMHLAAALGKPIVALFGDSPPERWHPWGVPYELVVPPTRDLGDLGVDQVAGAFARLAQRRL